jgi:hypothetical protein
MIGAALALPGFSACSPETRLDSTAVCHEFVEQLHQVDRSATGARASSPGVSSRPRDERRIASSSERWLGSQGTPAAAGGATLDSANAVRTARRTRLSFTPSFDGDRDVAARDLGTLALIYPVDAGRNDDLGGG